MKYTQSFKQLVRSSWLSFAFFTIAFSYSEFASKHGLLSLKYIGILLLLYNMVKKEIRLTSLPRNWFYMCSFLCLFFGLSCIPQQATFAELIQTLAYMIFIGTLCQYANRIVNKESDIFMIAIGILLAILLAIRLEPSAMVPKGVGRLRIYGGFMHPNGFGSAAMSVCFCLVICLFNKRKKVLYYVLILGIIAIAFDYIIKSDSNNALYTTLFFVALLLFFKISEHINIPLACKGIILIMFIVIAGFFIVNSMSDSLAEALHTRINSLSYIDTSDIFELLFGNGLVGLAENSSWGAEFSISQIIIKVGILGGIVLIYLFYYLSKNGVHNKNTDLGIYLSVLISFWVGSLAEAYIVNITNTFATLMWILVAAFGNGVRLRDTALFAQKGK